MKKRPPSPPPDDRHQRVLAAIRNGSRTWEEIAAATNLNNSKLGLIFNDLLTRKQVKSIEREGVRIYLLR
jgi:hypothetical protein